MLPQTDARLQQETMEILTPIYKEIGCCVMSDGWQSTSNRPILNVITEADGHVNVRRAFDTSGLDKNPLMDWTNLYVRRCMRCP